MFNRILESLENFCIHQIRQEHKVCENIENLRTIIASIDLTTNDGTTNRVYLAVEKNFAQKIAQVLLEEDESDDETLVDMVLESANLVVGSAKVLLSEKDAIVCSISTPTLHKQECFEMSYDRANSIKIQNDSVIVAIKEID
ncbi:MAG: chemotaxis protein CheX [Sulfurimonas sp.]|jgi:CheY-specific phosphatase CheX|nr:chemotaxis protein CheX [Sulfurimonadaceae bacterium]